MAIRDYRPEIDKSIVDNIRQNAKQQKISTKEYSDEELYNIWRDCYFCEDADYEIIHIIKTGKPPAKPEEERDTETITLTDKFGNELSLVYTEETFFIVVSHATKSRTHQASFRVEGEDQVKQITNFFTK